MEERCESMRLGGPRGQNDNVKMEQQTVTEPPSSEASAWPMSVGILGASTVGRGRSNSTSFCRVAQFGTMKP
jgi:hypothetical protein